AAAARRPDRVAASGQLSGFLGPRRGRTLDLADGTLPPANALPVERVGTLGLSQLALAAHFFRTDQGRRPTDVSSGRPGLHRCCGTVPLGPGRVGLENEGASVVLDGHPLSVSPPGDLPPFSNKTGTV